MQQQFRIQTAIREEEDSVKISHQRSLSIDFDMFEIVTLVMVIIIKVISSLRQEIGKFKSFNSFRLLVTLIMIQRYC